MENMTKRTMRELRRDLYKNQENMKEELLAAIEKQEGATESQE